MDLPQTTNVPSPAAGSHWPGGNQEEETGSLTQSLGHDSVAEWKGKLGARGRETLSKNIRL
ncbi:hypothetical protein SBA6_30019 [Candidatus Sulfopaludibacter sp. SbA6]|nr:hypothetical protein SBA6_30019 [Candidatus Sulfopaludibacter sp. SbA6]